MIRFSQKNNNSNLYIPPSLPQKPRKTLGIFDRISLKLQNKDWDNAFNEIIGLSYIKIRLMKDLVVYDAHDLIKRLYQIPTFKSIIKLVPTLISDNMNIDVSIFDELENEDASKIVQAALENPNTKYIERIVSSSKTLSVEWKRLYLNKFIAVCVNAPKIPHLAILLKVADERTIATIITELQEQKDPNNIIHIVHCIINNFQLKKKDKDILVSIMGASLNDKSNTRINIDSWVVYCEMTSMLLKSHPETIQKMMHKSSGDPHSKTIIFRGKQDVLFANAHGQFHMLLEQFKNIEISENGFLNSILDTQNDEELYADSGAFFVD